MERSWQNEYGRRRRRNQKWVVTSQTTAAVSGSKIQQNVSVFISKIVLSTRKERDFVAECDNLFNTNLTVSNTKKQKEKIVTWNWEFSCKKDKRVQFPTRTGHEWKWRKEEEKKDDCCFFFLWQRSFDLPVVIVIFNYYNYEEKREKWGRNVVKTSDLCVTWRLDHCGEIEIDRYELKFQFLRFLNNKTELE